MKSVIQIQERFTFESNKWFREQVAMVGSKEVELDFSKCDYIDSAGLGMLLQARDKFGKTNLVLTNANKSVRQVFAIANFDKIFRIT